MNNLYTSIIRYFLLMFLLLLITGMWMLLLHTSLNMESFTEYYVKKSLLGNLEIITPHLFAMGTVIFTLTHFLALKNLNSKLESKLTIILFTLMLSSNLSSLFIIQTEAWRIWIKIISGLLFLLFSLISIWKVFSRIKKNIIK